MPWCATADSSFWKSACFQSKARIRWISGSSLSNGLTGAGPGTVAGVADGFAAGAGLAARQIQTGEKISIVIPIAIPNRLFNRTFVIISAAPG
jgi:hypothetical protein